MEHLEQYQNVINDAISKAQQGLMRDVDVHLLNDLKRMSELGVLEVQQTQPEITQSKDPVKFTATWEGRLYFKGEDTIKKQQKALTEVKEFLGRIQFLIASDVFKEISDKVDEALQ